MRSVQILVLLTTSPGLLHGADPAEKTNRRQLESPGLVLNTPGRTGACDVLTFTPDGKHLLAAGDDKIVSIWNFSGQTLDPDPVQKLRWGIWREQRGSIYALALSPDPAGRLLAVGGWGLRTDAAVVMDRATRAIRHALTEPTTNFTLWALAFSPSGDRLALGYNDGSVWIWDLKKGKVTHLGKHSPGRINGQERLNQIRLVSFLTEEQVISVASDGTVLRWEVRPAKGQPTELFRFDQLLKVFKVVISPDRRWLTAVGEATGRAGAKGKSAQAIEVRSLDGRRKTLPNLPPQHFAQSLAYDHVNDRLAVGIRVVPDAEFYKITESHIYLYNLRNPGARPLATLQPTFVPEAMAFSPDGASLAVAGGNDHEVTLWRVPPGNKPQAVQTISGPGTGLWGVGLSRDGRYLGFQRQRAENPSSPNQLGDGTWEVFDLSERKWVRISPFQPIRPLESAAGWTVRFSLPGKTKNAFDWYAVGPNGVTHRLPLDPARDDRPRCFTFLPAEDGKPVQVAVGHYWGVSIFDLSPQGVHRARLLTGHGGWVTALGLSADHKLLVTASRDQTIAAWNLTDTSRQTAFGARFVLQKGKILVKDVDAGSPAWEAGLLGGEEVVAFAFGVTKFWYDPDNRSEERKRLKVQKTGTAAECLERLRNPEPGMEFFFQMRRGKEDFKFLSTIRQRPLWRFFPMNNREWVMWRWRDYYYDTSNHGDSSIGWHVNTAGKAVSATPEFFPAEQFRNRFHKPDKLARALQDPPEKVAIPDIDPPAVHIKVAAARVKDADAVVTLTVTPRAPLEQVNLWVNDYLFKTWPSPAGPFEQKVTVPQSALRRGTNVVTAQGYNFGIRGEARVTVHYESDRPLQARLHGLAVGIRDYTMVQKLNPKFRLSPILVADRDAQAMKDSWEAQAGTDLYRAAAVRVLKDREVTRVRLLAELDRLAREVRSADDLAVVFLAGHGYAEPTIRHDEEVLAVKPNSYVFVCYDSDLRRAAKTGVSGAELYERLAAIPCRKLVLLDTCHAGDVGAPTNPVRDFSRDGVPPLILAACRAHEVAREYAEKDHGYFTWAILEAMGEKFAAADHDRNGTLDGTELFGYVGRRVPELNVLPQHPTWSPEKPSGQLARRRGRP